MATLLTKDIPDLIAQLKACQQDWALTPIKFRLAVIRKLRRLLAREGRVLMEELADHSGKPRGEFAAAELIPLADACKFLERNAASLLRPKRLGRRGRPLWLAGARTIIHREPHGIVLVIGPSNYPLLLPGIQVVQALAAGNAVIVKPGDRGAESMKRLVDLLRQAGLPEGLVSVTGESIDDGRAVLTAPIDLVTLTGSATTGRAVRTALAGTPVPSVMELSGNDPVFILPAANINMAAKAVAYGLQLNGGATCIAPRRVFLIGQDTASFRDRLVALTSAAKPVTLGARIAARLRVLLDEAQAAGANVIGGVTHDRRKFTPVIVDNCPPDLPLMKEGIFAPVVMLTTASTADEALAMAAHSPYGLGASVFGKEAEATALAKRIFAGQVCVNDLIVPTADPRAPFGGWGASGYGLTRGAEGLLEMTRVKTVFVRKGRFRPHFDPLPDDQHELYLNFLTATHESGWTRRASAAIKAIGYLKRHGSRPGSD